MASFQNKDDGQWVIVPKAAVGAVTSSPVFWQLPTYRETGNAQGNEAHITASMRWSEWRDMPGFLLGDVRKGGEGGKLQRQLPLQHPTKTWLYCTGYSLNDGKGAYRLNHYGLLEYFDNRPDPPPLPAGVLPPDDATPAPTDGRAIFQLDFTPLPYEVAEDDGIVTEQERFLIRETRYNLEAMALPGNTFKYADTLKLIPTGSAIQRPTLELHLTWVWVPDEVYRTLETGFAWRNTIGAVNVAAFHGFAAGRCLALPPRVTPLMFTPTGTKVRNIEYVFGVRLDSSWNAVFRRGSGFVNVIPAFPGDSPPYRVADFSDLFKIT